MIERCVLPGEQRLSDELLLSLSAVLAERTGLNFSGSRLADLERGVLSAASDLGCADPGEFLRQLTSSPMTRERIEVLASRLTVGETYFFRDRQSLEALRTRVLPELTGGRAERGLRIWSAGCATGEEPYSVAILLDAALAAPPENVTILGTDINPRFLEKARAGVYGEWSFRDTPRWVRDRYFTKTRTGFAVLPLIRNRVTFEYHNLAEDPFPSLLNGTNAMDIIFCRNVLMYFLPGRAAEVAENLYRCLVEGGWLFVSPVETAHTLFSRFETVNENGVTLYRKGRAPAYSVSVPLPQRPAPPPGPQRTRLGAKPSPALRPGPAGKAEKEHGYEQARGLYERGLYAEAAEAMIPREEQAAGGPDVRTLSLLARSLANQGKLADALRWCEQAIAADKLNPGLYYLASTILQEQGLLEEAGVLLRRAIYLDRGFALAHFALGMLARRQGNRKESEKHFENARALLEPRGPDDVLPESDGMLAGRLKEIIERLTIDEGIS